MATGTSSSGVRRLHRKNLLMEDFERERERERLCFIYITKMWEADAPWRWEFDKHYALFILRGSYEVNICST